MIPHWLWEFLGLSGQGPWYAWWSAFAGSAAMTVLFGGAAYWWHHDCAEHRCWRVGRHMVTHPVHGTQVRSCRKHHKFIDHTKPFHIEEWLAQES